MTATLPPFHDDPKAAPCSGKHKLFCSDLRSSQELAKLICRGCEQRGQCFAYGMAIKATACVYGGVTFPGEARVILRAIRRKAQRSERATPEEVADDPEVRSFRAQEARRDSGGPGIVSSGAPAHVRGRALNEAS